jgi:hypothetical protein
MLNYFRNIISLFTALVMLAGGNFIYAVAHGDCVQVEGGYISCEMECCKENPCLDDLLDKTEKIKDDSKSCCQLHIEQAVEQDITMPVISKTSELTKIILAAPELQLTSIDTFGSPQVIHKFKTTNIFLTVSNLRI